MDEFTVADAAQRLGVSTRRVRALLAAGDLTETRRAGRAVLLAAESVDRLLRARGGGAADGRPWTSPVAWGAIAVLAGATPHWLTQHQRRRLLAALSGLSAQDVVAKTRRRAEVRAYAGLNLPSHRVVRTGGYALEDETVARQFGLAAGAGSWDGYCARDDLGAVIEELDLYTSSRPDHTLRVIDDARWLQVAATAPRPVLVGLDLAESASTRERSAGLRVVEEGLSSV